MSYFSMLNCLYFIKYMDKGYMVEQSLDYQRQYSRTILVYGIA